jgi:SAM-dependent methyltransferase
LKIRLYYERISGMTTKYSQAFYDEMKVTNLTSARVVVRHLLSLIKPRSVVDVGCGTGTWLKAFSEAGVKDIFGIDGDWVKKEMLVIPESAFSAEDFEKPFKIKRKADLAVCLEVAEHLPHSSSDVLVENLTSVAPVILFSAAIPFQGGSHHVNEQWPDYWRKAFDKKGYIPVDCIRRKVWEDKEVSFFYAQNVLVYVDKAKLSSYPSLEEEIRAGNGNANALVHPYMYLYYAERWRMLVPFLGKLPPSFLHAVKKTISSFRRKK